MKYLLLPVTLVAWYFLTYLSFYGLYAFWSFGMQTSWIALILILIFLIGIVYYLLITIPSMIKTFIVILYQKKWAVLLHSGMGLLAFVDICLHVTSSKLKAFNHELYDHSHLKAIFLMIICTILALTILVSNFQMIGLASIPDRNTKDSSDYKPYIPQRHNASEKNLFNEYNDNFADDFAEEEVLTPKEQEELEEHINFWLNQKPNKDRKDL